MVKFNSLFELHIAKSHAFEAYRDGSVAFISNGFSNNGVVGYVEPMPKDRIFQPPCISVSAFCEATVQNKTFIARGNGGSGLVILKPIKPMAESDLLWYAAYINETVRWRFSFGRMVTLDRLANVEVPDTPTPIKLKAESLIPEPQKTQSFLTAIDLVQILLSSLFVIKSGDYHNAADLSAGSTPLISCGKTDNGLISYCDIPATNIYSNALTVAYNGAPLTTHYHPYAFAAKDDVAVLLAKRPFKGTTLLFIQLMISKEAWRYSYGRKCFREKLSKMSVGLPVKKGEIDEDIISQIMRNTAYWNFISPMVRDAEPVSDLQAHLF